MKIFLKALIKGYCWLISPLIGQSCRFHPTCSAYAIEAIDHHGSLKGVLLASKRIMKCHPYYKGDLNDPVPLTKNKRLIND